MVGYGRLTTNYQNFSLFLWINMECVYCVVIVLICLITLFIFVIGRFFSSCRIFHWWDVCNGSCACNQDHECVFFSYSCCDDVNECLVIVVFLSRIFMANLPLKWMISINHIVNYGVKDSSGGHRMGGLHCIVCWAWT